MTSREDVRPEYGQSLSAEPGDDVSVGSGSQAEGENLESEVEDEDSDWETENSGSDDEMADDPVQIILDAVSEHPDILENLQEWISENFGIKSADASERLTMIELIGDTGNAYLGNFLSRRNVLDITHAIVCLAQAVELTHGTHESYNIRLSTLGSAYHLRFDHLGHLADIDASIEYQFQAMVLTSDQQDEKPSILTNLGNAYQRRFERQGELTDIDSAIQFQSQAISLTPNGHAEVPSRLVNLGNAYQSRFECKGDLADINTAIEYQSQALSLTPDSHPNKALRLNNLGNSYRSRFEQQGSLSDINEAVDLLSQAIHLTQEGSANRPSVLNNLGIAYRCRAEDQGSRVDIDAAIECQSQAVSLTPSDHSNRVAWLVNLGNAYRYRFELDGVMSDINTAIEHLVNAASSTPKDHPSQAHRLSSLGNAYRCRFEHQGNLSDIHTAIEIQYKALELTTDDHIDRPSRLLNLGVACQCRYKHQRDITDINSAIQYGEQALLLTPDGHPRKPSILGSLGNVFSYRFEYHYDREDIEKAIEYHSRALKLSPDGRAEKSSWLSNLAGDYYIRFERYESLTDINTAIQYANKVVLPTSDGHAPKPVRLHNLGLMHHSRFERQGDLADIDAAIDFQSQAVALVPDGHADKAVWLNSLGQAYMRRFECTSVQEDINNAYRFFQEAVQFITGSPYNRLDALHRLARLANTHGLCEAQTIYQQIMETLTQVAWVGSTVFQRYERIIEMGNLASEAACYAIKIKNYESALEWLEAGRVIVWNQALQLRKAFGQVSNTRPDLSHRLKEVGQALDRAGSRPSLHYRPTNIAADLEADALRHFNLAVEWNKLLHEARSIPGHENFLRPQRWNVLKSASKTSPIAIINIFESRCDALIVLPGVNKIAHVPLPRFSEEAALSVRDQFQTLTGNRQGGIVKANKSSRSKPKSEWGALLETLWLGVVKPVLEYLGYTRRLPADELPHLTWCTTGVLSLLPLHAAGPCDNSQPGAFDVVISSYTPSLSALLLAPHGDWHFHSGVLGVGQANSPGKAPLYYTGVELEAVKKHLDMSNYTQLDNSRATVQSVLQGMRDNSWVHFACHATQDVENPLLSAFHLHDGDLTLEEISRQEFSKKGLAYLSACQTAAGDKELPDEAVHLAAGLLIAGYPSVIATMWSISDVDGPPVAEEVYAELLKERNLDYTGAAGALHKAVESLRKNVGADAVSRWAPFMHIGVN